MRRFGEWITEWPWTKTFTMTGVIGFVLTLLIAGLSGMTMWLVPSLQPSTATQLDLLREARNWFNDALQWTVLAATGGLLGNGLVRATTKPDVIRAQAEVAKGTAPRDAMSENGP